ncbi:MAG TPA: ACT domain-containing protein [bacterium (Candidatus Stahlbacteria)]|nr:ACT domain-containing protein [Candidatus Stahlbacteria bacterium]
MKVYMRDGVSRVTLKGVKDRPGIAAHIFTVLGEFGFGVENISHSGGSRGRADISFTVLDKDLDEIINLLKSKITIFNARDVHCNPDIVEVTVKGMDANRPGMAGRAFTILGSLGINIEMITTALNTLTIVINKDKAQEAVAALKERFAKSS